MLTIRTSQIKLSIQLIVILILLRIEGLFISTQVTGNFNSLCQKFFLFEKINVSNKKLKPRCYNLN